MSNSKDILQALINEDAVLMKKLINEALFSKLGNALEDKLVEFAPTVFEGAEGGIPKTKREKKLAAKTPPTDKITRGDVITAAKEKNESVELTDDMLIETFQNEVAQIVQEIQEETGEELTEEEIKEIAEEYLQILEETEEQA